MRHASIIALLLGLWIGGSLLIFGVVGYSFPGVVGAIERNEKLAERVDFDPHDEVKKKESVLWVYTGEQNRAYFQGWNLAQLFLGGLTLLLSFFLVPRRSLWVVLLLALVLVAVMRFYLTPEIVTLGRTLDFVPRATEPPGMGKFNTLHQVYTYLDATKVLLLGIGAFLTIRAAQRA